MQLAAAVGSRSGVVTVMCDTAGQQYYCSDQGCWVHWLLICVFIYWYIDIDNGWTVQVEC